MLLATLFSNFSPDGVYLVMRCLKLQSEIDLLKVLSRTQSMLVTALNDFIVFFCVMLFICSFISNFTIPFYICLWSVC